MSRIMDELRKETVFKTNVTILIRIMKHFDISIHEAMNVIAIPVSEQERYIAAIRDTEDQSQ